MVSFLYEFVLVSYINVRLISGIPQQDDLGMGKFPGGSFDFVNQVFKIFSPDEFKEFKSHTAVLNPFIEDTERFQILMLLILSELNENASALRFRTAILSSVFHIDTRNSVEDENQILGPYFQMICTVKKLYHKAKILFDAFAQS